MVVVSLEHDLDEMLDNEDLLYQMTRRLCDSCEIHKLIKMISVDHGTSISARPWEGGYKTLSRSLYIEILTSASRL